MDGAECGFGKVCHLIFFDCLKLPFVINDDPFSMADDRTELVMGEKLEAVHLVFGGVSFFFSSKVWRDGRSWLVRRHGVSSQPVILSLSGEFRLVGGATPLVISCFCRRGLLDAASRGRLRLGSREIEILLF